MKNKLFHCFSSAFLFMLLLVCFIPFTKAATANIPRYGVVCQFDEYPACASALSDLRQGGLYWIRGDCITPSAAASFWSSMKSEDIEVLGVLNQGLLQLGDVTSSWQAYVQGIVNAAPDIPAWEICNEPDQTYYITPQTYMTYLQQAYTIIKAANPNALIIGPAVGCSSSGAQYLSTIKSLGAFNYLDAISVHYYVTLGYTDLQSIKSVVAGAKPIWITETGYPSTTSGGEAAQNSYVRTYLNPKSGILGSDPSIQVITYYDLNNADDGWGLNNGYPSYIPKQAYVTFKDYLNVSSSLTQTPTACPSLPQELIYGTAIVLIVATIITVVLILKNVIAKAEKRKTDPSFSFFCLKIKISCIRMNNECDNSTLTKGQIGQTKLTGPYS